MLDRNKIGHEFSDFTIEVEKGRLRFFAKVIGENNPIYLDENAAREAGYESLPAPPTFLAALYMDGPDNMPELSLLGVDLADTLHGSQEFEYFAPICAGDKVRVRSRITDIFDKRGGALEFIITETIYTNQEGQVLANATSTIILRNS